MDKYNWVDVGSSFLPSEIIAAFLFAQLESLQIIQKRRLELWKRYYKKLQSLKRIIQLPFVPVYATMNGHLFYFACNSADERQRLISFLKQNGVHSVFHYLSLHKSPFYKSKYESENLIYADRYTDTLIRLPLFYELESIEQDQVIYLVNEFYKNEGSQHKLVEL